MMPHVQSPSTRDEAHKAAIAYKKHLRAGGWTAEMARAEEHLGYGAKGEAGYTLKTYHKFEARDMMKKPFARMRSGVCEISSVDGEPITAKVFEHQGTSIAEVSRGDGSATSTTEKS